MSFGGGFRMVYQPFRPFIAGTKVAKYVVMKNQLLENEREESRNNSPTMIRDGLALSPPPTPIDLCAQTKLMTPTISNKFTPDKVRSPTSPGFTYDGFTFTADVGDLFTVESPVSPPESYGEYDPTELSLDSDVTMEDALVPERKMDVGTSGSYISAELAEAAIQAVQSEPGLGPAITTVLKTGSMMPLVKEELRCTIQTKRLAKGKGELEVSEGVKPAEEELTPEEEERRRRRRERNKIAAQKCRDKKMVTAKKLTEETELLENANSQLRDEVKHLEEELESLRCMMIRHDKTTQCGVGTLSSPSETTSTPSSTQHQHTRSRKTPASRPSKRQRTK